MKWREVMIVPGVCIALGIALVLPTHGHETGGHFTVGCLGIVKGQNQGSVFGSTIAVSGTDCNGIIGSQRTVRLPASYVTTPPQPAFYVSPAGDDGNDGAVDSPFKTLQKAQQAMRAGSVKTTYLRAGAYHLDEALILSQFDSGQAWLNYPGEKPLYLGGEVITGFREEASGRYSAPISFNPGLDVTLKGIRQRPAQTGSWNSERSASRHGLFFP